MSTHSIIASNTQPIVCGPVGRCIYCPNTDNLSREHVIPFGLGGALILLKASCPDCRKATQKFEEYILHNDLGVFRAEAGFPTNNKKARQERDPDVPLYDKEWNEVKRVPSAELPLSFSVPVFHHQPGIVTNRVHRPASHSVLTVQKDDERLRLAREQHGDLGPAHELHSDQFIRFLAKIAHGVIFWACDTTNMRPFLMPIVLDGKTSDAGYLVGSAEFQLPPTSVINLKTGAWHTPSRGHYVGVNMRLFAETNRTPTYTIIVGEFKERVVWTNGAHLPRPGGRPR